MNRRVIAGLPALCIFVLTACGGGSDADGGAVQPPPPAAVAPTVALTSSAGSVANGGSVTLTWSSTNATSCTASGGWSGTKTTSGSAALGPLSSDTTATLACTGAGGSAQQSVTVTVTNTPPPPPPAPTVTLTATPTTVTSGASSMLNWSSTNATSCSASGAWSGAKASSGSQSTGVLTSLSIYTLSCTGVGGTAQASATVDVTAPPPVGNSAVSGKVDSSFTDIKTDNRVYVFAGNVTPDDDDGDGGDPLQRVAVTQDANACTFSYAVDGLAPGTYTLAFTRQAASDRPDQADSISFSGTTTVTVSATPQTQNFAPGSILRVGPGRTYATIAAAANAASAGAVIEVDAGTYPDDVVVWRENRVTVRSIGGRAHVQGNRRIPFQSGSDRNNGMGLWVVRGSDIRVENIEFSNAQVDDLNGAGIRNQGSNLTICNSVFRDNENGILGGAYGQLTIEYSTFMRNGSGDVGRTHNLYIDEGSSAGDKLVFRHNYSHHASIGHLLKTRARENWILYNRIMDEDDGTSSYAIDAPNGGLTYVIGNLIQQGASTDNSIIVAYGAEGLSGGRTHALYVINNTFVNDRGSGQFFDVAGGTTTFRSTNNLFVGGGTLYSGTQPTAANNLVSNSPGFVNRTGFDYRLTLGSPAIEAGTNPGTVGSDSLMPLFQYVNPANRAPRATAGSAIDVGAYEFTP